MLFDFGRDDIRPSPVYCVQKYSKSMNPGKARARSGLSGFFPFSPVLGWLELGRWR